MPLAWCAPEFASPDLDTHQPGQPTLSLQIYLPGTSRSMAPFMDRDLYSDSMIWYSSLGTIVLVKWGWLLPEPSLYFYTSSLFWCFSSPSIPSHPYPCTKTRPIVLDPVKSLHLKLYLPEQPRYVVVLPSPTLISQICLTFKFPNIYHLALKLHRIKS